ncbi:hypothetical protein FM113_13550 [Leucobacter sp. 7(1)]|uniref:hypothetical protein n=1 Tax=Leucobacter sp. 7(1) TaxID=1255613 RepID=UPI00097ECCE2|nr:hypothetical protein [Leucobacter sp. 7(1)]SJN11973.1 hypothetical protein FM113_13550 [Leucobacter sp. 7(1)]
MIEILPDVDPVFDSSNGHLTFRVAEATRRLAPCVVALTDAGVLIEGISVQHASLDDVFFALTGQQNVTDTINAADLGIGQTS